jgi:hypothetical protein
MPMLRMLCTIPPLSCISSLFIYLQSIDSYMVGGQVDVEVVKNNKKVTPQGETHHLHEYKLNIHNQFQLHI